MQITSVSELEDLLGAPMPRAVHKERNRLSQTDRDWLALSSFVLVGTADADGNCDVSPKGDPPGFVHVLDDRTIAVPERPGNRRADGFHNILANPHVGLIFLVPGRRETLRINGRARLLTDAPWFDELIVEGHKPILAMVVDIDTIFFHCQKAFMRSKLWKPETWTPDALPTHAKLVKSVMETPESVEELEAYYAEDRYSRGLYA
ncbi:pyridoxamine 5'-phosphate oxidase family protein [Dactylosporangium matsuzakiense]|uniref:Phosphohydrolase n=1 Tax=Dactylosporangium matsuzakiense TaxID=53360 RepID=A0A9W6KF98_9ACTN|nr:pyridoxamine 5'-phosphate oxidase family protein [Dactylosporangium matsuzakiense]UWZ47176.1 pyridoxamine 5'-phosphate oxidase family protein [Dactylosporangium matsuzakiense]GLK98388.1 phosphohydrolase [Dactylosporangium matsuzakiense]